MGLGLFSNKNGKTLEQIKQDVEDIKKKNNTGKVKTAGKTNDVEELVLGMVAAGMCDITGTINSGSAQQLLNGKKSFLRFIKEDVRKSTHMFQNFTHGFKKVFIQDSFKVHLTGIDPGAFDLTPLNVAMTITGEGANVDTLINLLKELKGEDVQNISLGLETIRDILGYISEIKFDGSNLKSLDQLPEILKTLSKSLTEVNIDFSKIDQIEELKKVVGYLNDINLVLSNLSTNPEVANNVKLLNEGIEGVSKTIDIIASIDVKGIKTKSKVLTDGVDAVAEFSKKIDEAFPKNASLSEASIFVSIFSPFIGVFI